MWMWHLWHHQDRETTSSTAVPLEKLLTLQKLFANLELGKTAPQVLRTTRFWFFKKEKILFCRSNYTVSKQVFFSRKTFLIRNDKWKESLQHWAYLVAPFTGTIRCGTLQPGEVAASVHTQEVRLRWVRDVHGDVEVAAEAQKNSATRITSCHFEFSRTRLQRWQ